MTQATEVAVESLTIAESEAGALVPFLPENVNQAWSMAKALSKSQLVPRSLQGKPYDLLATLITGRELGLSPMQSIRGMHVIEGKAVMSSELMVALVISKTDVCEYFQLVETTDKLATYATKRRGYDKPTQMTFSIEDATRAGLVGKDNWKRYPAAMLRARCSSGLCRAVYPDLVGGVYEPDEAEEFAPPTPATALRAVPGGSKLDQLSARLARTEDGGSVNTATGEVIDAQASDDLPFASEAESNALREATNTGGPPDEVTQGTGAAKIVHEETGRPAGEAAPASAAGRQRRF